MDAISCWQPWATLIAIGEKHIETRSYRPPARMIGRFMAIHATASAPRVYTDRAWGDRHIVEALARNGTTKMNWTGHGGSLPQRAIVALARIRDVLPTEDMVRLWDSHKVGTVPNYHEDRERSMGDYAPRRYAWRLTDVVGLNSCPITDVKGHQRIWPVSPNLIDQLKKRIEDYGIKVPADLFE